MILPGTQTLFGFQLIVVFNPCFQERLSPGEQYLHLLATMLVATATAMLIAPAAYHRRVEPEQALTSIGHGPASEINAAGNMLLLTVLLLTSKALSS